MHMDKKFGFIARFIEACGTSEPAEIQRLLSISYQAAKNYLNGRLPNSYVLLTIADKTSCSLDWLLTGRGKKFIDSDYSADAPLASRQMEAFVRRVCIEVINEMNGGQEPAHPKVVILQPSELMSEKLLDEAQILTGKQS